MKFRHLPPLDVNQRYTVEEAAAYLRQSRAKTYSDISIGKLSSLTDGRRRYIPGWAIARASGAMEVIGTSRNSCDTAGAD